MAEENQEDEEEDYYDIECRQIYVAPERGRPTVARVDDMSKPPARVLLSLYQNYACMLPPDKMMRIKKMVEETYSMSPEQTERYFQEIREERRRRKLQRKQRRKEHNRYKKMKLQEKKAKVRLKVICIIRDCMLKAFHTPLKILMSERLRQISDVCLSQLCEILRRKVPDRDTSDKVSRMLVCFSNWIAYWVETIAYDIEVDKEKVKEVPSAVSKVEFVQSRTQTEVRD